MIKKLLLFTVAVLCPVLSSAQVIYETISSLKLQEDREIKIQLPRNYEENKEKRYPVAIVLDGDYLFEPVAGIADYYSYWEEIPEMIVIGVNQDGTRRQDASYDERQFLPAKQGAAFFEFLGMELLNKIDEKYRTSTFRIIVGHDFTSNFINYYLLKPNPVFQGYINLSPDLAPEMANRVTSALATAQSKKWYYLATGSEDIPQLQESIFSFSNQLKGINNELVSFKFENFEHATHYSLVGKAIPSAMESIFEAYRPISQKEFNEVLLQTSVSPTAYLKDRYESINNLFGIEKQIRINDFMAIHQAIEKTRRWDEYKELSKLAADNFPRTMLATYFEARYEEETGNPKKAMRTYQNAYGQQKIAFLTVDFMMEKANAIKRDFGY
ncbi:alpha/beta hydrolase [Autumnicola musiva]|uniref:Alpha/beta hydrolase-fold protein n=1 Tax=Autumnicola musiva TaxID=3075589 RepID=A0ABU3D888_9FLAO|nr:alpha/beta hydrolase-fold protein [Zunongwangia sp. F117]MDT0677742.1 alpha/beta hydrolase-fold protein [Zunongwangia sp. F117]